ncbi:MAG: hypothetical protein IBV52_03590 [Candidatus Bathyarchaeota archaeon]
MRNVYLVAVVVTLLVSAVVVSAEPSMMGYSGLLMVPTTDTVNDGGYNVAISSSELSGWDDRAYIANFGLQDGLEAGIWWWHPERGNKETLLNIKYQFESGTPGRASLALGVSDVTDEIDTAVYFVASKDVGQPIGTTIDGKRISRLTLHGGIGGGWIDDFFFGLEARLGDRLTLIAEHFNDDLSVGVRLRLWRHIAVDTGYINTEDWSANLSYNYPLGTTGALQPIIGD